MNYRAGPLLIAGYRKNAGLFYMKVVFIIIMLNVKDATSLTLTAIMSFLYVTTFFEKLNVSRGTHAVRERVHTNRSRLPLWRLLYTVRDGSP